MRARVLASASAVAALLVVTACSSSTSKSTPGGSTTSSAATSAAAPTTGAATSAAAGGAVDDNNAWALAYTGGTAGAASGEPYKIGYVSQDNFLPQATVGANAARDYINAELGGVGGRPIDLVECSVTSPEDATTCGSKLANDSSIQLVIVGAMNVGNKELYAAIGGKKAILVGNALATEDFVTPDAVSYTSGSPGVLIGMAQFAAVDLKAKTVAAIIPDTPGGRAAVQQLLKPIFDAAHVTLKQTFISATATTPEMSTALQATGAAKADAVITATPSNLCISLYDAMKQLSISPKVITTDQCADSTVQAALSAEGEASAIPDGWYFGNYGYNYNLPDVASGMATYVIKGAKYAKPVGSAPVELAGGFAGPTFATVMSAVKILNQVGVDKATYATLNTALRAFTGPAMLQAGPIKCGVPPFVAACGHDMGIDQYTGGKWVSVRDALNGKPISLLPNS
ncbi:MAG TPA: ABC transporter substrate-binding protein [Mycobacteriales bacterium]|nr:ABC transporter substrate-binding protein [Mycobacteriales bacterium]